MSSSKFRKAVAVMAGVLFSLSSYGDFNWFNMTTNMVGYYGSNTGLAYSRTDSSVGCFVQLIWAGPNNTIDAPVFSNVNGAGGDDVVQVWSWFGRGAFGDQSGVVPTISPNTLTTDSSGYYYVRAWSAPSPDLGAGQIPNNTSNYFGNSVLWLNPGNEPGPDEFNFGGNGDANNIGWRLTTQIPEPATMGLGILGLISLRLFSRKRK